MASIIKADTLQSTTANVFVLNSSGTEYARFDSSGVFQLANPTTFPAGTVSLPSITATGDTNTGLYFPAADTIAFTEGGTEVMRINSSGNIGIGTASPAGKLHIAGNNGPLRISGGNYVTNPTEFTLGQYDSTTAYLQIPGGATGRIDIWDGGTSPIAIFNQYGMGLYGTLPTSGSGITFPSTQQASSNANTLDDYEEGTWTPTLVSTGGGAPAYTTQVGRYYKIGGVVYVFGSVTINGTLPAGNYTRIQGLPFGQTSALSGVALKYSGATGVSSGQFITAAIGGGEISFARNDGNGEIGVVGLNASYISTSFNATFSTMYQAS